MTPTATHRNRRVLVISHPAVLPVNQHQYLALEALGWDVHLVTPTRWRHDFRSDVFPASPLEGMEGNLDPIPVILGGRQQRHAYLVRAERFLRRNRPDVVFVEQEPFSVSALQWGRAATRAGIPFGIQAAETLDRPFPYPIRRARSSILDHAAFVVARSPAAADLARTWGASGVVEVVPHPVPGWKEATVPPRNAFTIGYAGRLVPEKGVGDLVAAVRQMRSPARLLLVGNGPLLHDLEAEDDVEVWSGCRHEDMPDAFARMDVLVLPSLHTSTWEEQFGRVLTEALSCGVPVVGSATGAIPWVVERTGGGWCYPEGDVAALAATLDMVVSDPVGRRRRAETGRDVVAREFTSEAVARKLHDLLGEAAESVDAPPRTSAPDGRRPALTFVAHDVGGVGGMERMHAETLERLAGSWDVTVHSVTLDPGLARLVTWRRVRIPRRPVQLKFALFFVVVGCRLRGTRHAGVRHTCGAIVPNRVDVASVHLCHAGLVSSTKHFAPPGAPLMRRANTGMVRRLALLGERWCYRPERLGTAHVVSRGVAGEMAEHYPGVVVVVVPNGVDSARFSPDSEACCAVRAQHGVPQRALVALFVGGDWDHKGLAVAIKSVAVARRLGSDVRLWVVGRGDRDRFSAIARDDGVEEYVTFLGQRSDPSAYYRGADVLVLPSAYEAAPLVVNEAAATGIPVVATAVHGAIDLVGHNEAGVIVKRDESEIGQVLMDLADDRERLRALGEEARRRAVAWSWGHVADRLDEELRVPLLRGAMCR